MIQLRGYQEDAVASVYPLQAGTRKLLVIPTGGGKSLILAQLAHNQAMLGERTLILTHVQELVEQNAAELNALSPELEVGIYCSALKKYASHRTVTVASVQSVYKRLEEFADVTLVLIDECHRVSPQGGKMYRAVLDAFKQAAIVGCSATPFRMGTGYLHKGENAIFSELSYEAPYEQLVADGWLAPFAEKGSELAYDTAKVHIQAGEFKQNELDELVDYPKTKRIIEQALARSADRRFKLCFAINLRHCAIIQAILTELGHTSVILHGSMTPDERKNARYEFELGLIDVAINCNIWGTGYNFKQLDCIWLLRPTASVGFFIQIAGRLTRTAEGKTDGLLLDYGGNVSRHGHFSKPEVRERRKSGATKNCTACGEMNSIMVRYCTACSAKFDDMFKDCPKCETEVDRMAQTCPECGYGWPVNEQKLDEEGGTMLPNQAIWINVIDWNFRIHEKEGSPFKSFVAKYKTVDNGTLQEYVFPEHPNASDKFVKWWNLHGSQETIHKAPQSATEAYARRNEIRCPDKIKVIRSGKFYVFLGRDFGQLAKQSHHKPTTHLNGTGSRPINVDAEKIDLTLPY